MMNLDELSIKYDNEKGAPWHDYMIEYEKYLAPLRDKEIVLLELGIGLGVSLKIWKEYFTKGIIHGIDLGEKCREYAEPRVFVHIGRQEDIPFLESVCNVFDTGFDVIIDDGSHRFHHQLVSLSYLLPHLQVGGYYFIEDLSLVNLEYKIEAFRHVTTLWSGKEFKVLPVYYGKKKEQLWGVVRVG